MDGWKYLDNTNVTSVLIIVRETFLVVMLQVNVFILWNFAVYDNDIKLEIQEEVFCLAFSRHENEYIC